MSFLVQISRDQRFESAVVRNYLNAYESTTYVVCEDQKRNQLLHLQEAHVSTKTDPPPSTKLQNS